MGMVVADDFIGPVPKAAHQLEMDFGVDQEAFLPVALGDVGAGLDP